MERGNSNSNKNKKEAFLRYLHSHSIEDNIEYRRLSAVVKKEVRRVKRQSWETFVSRIEHGVLARQTKSYKILKELKNERDNPELNPVR
jgi:dihydroneopterin aldolase